MPKSEQKELGERIDFLLGEDKAKSILQDLAMVIAKHDLVHEVEICTLLFRYMCFVKMAGTKYRTRLLNMNFLTINILYSFKFLEKEENEYVREKD